MSVKLQKKNGKLVMVSVEERNGTLFRGMCRRLVEAKWFDRLIMSAILLNTLTMALERYSDVPGEGTLGDNANETEKGTLEQCNAVFFWIFFGRSPLFIVVLHAPFCSNLGLFLALSSSAVFQASKVRPFSACL